MRYLPMDQAGWHTTAKLTVTDNICILTPPSRSPEPNPVENIRRFMRENWLSNRVFNFYNDIVDHCLTNKCWQNTISNTELFHDLSPTSKTRVR